MFTRSKAAKTKEATEDRSGQPDLRRNAFQALCESVIAETRARDFLENKSMVAATYHKMVCSRKRLLDQRGVSSDDEDTFLSSEELERKLIAACEELYNALPAQHPSRAKEVPAHFEANEGTGSSPKKAETPPKVFGFKEPRQSPLDGRHAAKWAAWRQAFDREVHNNVSLSSEQEFEYLLPGIKEKTPSSMLFVITEAYKAGMSWLTKT